MVMQPLGLQQNFGFILTEEHDPYFCFMWFRSLRRRKYGMLSDVKL